MAKYRKKPIVIDAIQLKVGERPHELAEDVAKGLVEYWEDGTALIHTLEGILRADPGDWIVRGVKGELYPVKPDIFEKLYEACE